MEDSFRPFVEECDNLQGLHLMHDTNQFGGLIHSFLGTFRDEFVKLPTMAFPFISDAVTDSDNVSTDNFSSWPMGVSGILMFW